MGSLLLTSPSNHLALRVSDSRVAKGHVLLMRNIVTTAIWSPGSNPTFLCCGPLVGPVACGRRYSRAATGKTLTVAWPPSINPQAPAFQVDATCFDPVSGQFDSPVVTVNPGAGTIAITCPGVASAGRAERVVRVLRR